MFEVKNSKYSVLYCIIFHFNDKFTGVCEFPMTKCLICWSKISVIMTTLYCKHFWFVNVLVFNYVYRSICRIIRRKLTRYPLYHLILQIKTDDTYSERRSNITWYFASTSAFYKIDGRVNQCQTVTMATKRWILLFAG